MRRPDELDAFKSKINLSEYAASCGFERDRKASSRNCCVMRRGNGEKIVIGLASDHHWIYFSVNDASDNGSIIDFVQKREGGSLGDVRKELRPWLDGFRPTGIKDAAFAPSLLPLSRDLLKVKATFEAMEPVLGHHRYLEEGRGVPASVLASKRFAGRVFVDSRQNAVFPHANKEGLCGYELKNAGFTGFSPGGEKGLWHSNALESDQSLVIAETAIDALSYATLKGLTRTRFFSIGGEMNPHQPGLLSLAMEKLALPGEIILAMDNDEGGDRIAEKIQAVFRETNRQGLRLSLDRPRKRGHDWNDSLRASIAASANL